MQKHLFLLFAALATLPDYGQLAVARDTITVLENNYVLKMPWNNGLNYSNLSTCELNFDGKKDLVAYDRINQFGTGRFRCFLNNGNVGEIKYAAGPEYSYNFPQVSNWAVLLDYNCDGKEDIFCSTNSGIMVYKNVSVAPTLSFTLVKPLLYSYYYPNVPNSYWNLYASPSGVPGISDFDGDGDLDILSFSALGVFAEYHKNLSQELYGSCDSLVFERASDCWGKFSESSCSSAFNQCGNKPAPVTPPAHLDPDPKTYHAGACLTCFDSDGDSDMDLILGDISCNTVEYLHNTGNVSTALISDSTKLYPNFPAKGNTTQIKINNFPCTYYVDVDRDAKKDLIATPSVFGSENAQSVWLYKNTSLTSTVNFQFVKNNFLQDEMIEVGLNSFPVIIDYNADGKKDLLIGNCGYYLNGGHKSRLTLYENTGTAAQPVYSLVTRDYAGLSAQNLNYAIPAVGDVDNDGDVDICIGVSSGQVHWLKNTAGAGNPCNFTFIANSFSFTTNSAVAAPQLFDMDNDGKLDLLIGTKNGRISYYRNNSTVASSPSFTLMSNFFGSVDVKGDVNLYGIDGYAVPYFYNEGGTTKLLVGSVNGNIFHYTVPAAYSGAFNLVNNTTNNYNEGGQSAPYFEDINNDNLRDLLIGNAGGGLALFSSKSPYIGFDQNGAEGLANLVSLYPNPVNGLLNLRVEKLSFDRGEVSVYNLLGESMMQTGIDSNSETIDLGNLSPGVYFVNISLSSGQNTQRFTKKIIKE
jgi:hypothetical protein